LASNASNSTYITALQLGFFMASRADLGIGNRGGVEAAMAYLGFGLKTPALLRVVIGCTGGTVVEGAMAEVGARISTW
jgi:hypothetical protein